MATTGTTPIITFARRKKGASHAKEVDTKDEESPPSTESTDSQTLAATNGLVKVAQENEAENCQSPAPRWRRHAVLKDLAIGGGRHLDALADLKAYYDEVDAYSLTVETPTPPGKQQLGKLAYDVDGAVKSHRKSSKHMSFGLSRRASVIGLSRPSIAPTSPPPLLPPVIDNDEKRNSTAGPRSTQLQGRRSSTARPSLLSRMSIGIGGALQWLGAGGVSPIVESDENEFSNADTATDNLVEDLSVLKLEDKTIKPSTPDVEQIPATSLSQLIQLCGQDATKPLPNMEQFIESSVGSCTVKKIGEGTFGEAFKANDLILKIVPLEGSTLVNGEVQKRAEEILGEVIVTLALSNLRTQQLDNGEVIENSTSAFVETFGVGICKGQYAPQLLKEWHAWDSEHGSENEAVDIFTADQLFVVFMVANGGLDLEHFEIRDFDELRSILLQITLALAVAEEACGFEHRDLHWGNVLISRSTTHDKVNFRLRGVDIEVESRGVQVTIIDFTLSRLKTASGGLAYCDLNLDPALFEGPKGDFQAETYRRMRKAVKNDWSSFVPKTNTLWLWYLTDIIMTTKLPKCDKACVKELRDFRKHAMLANRAAELVWDDLFAGYWVSG